MERAGIPQLTGSRDLAIEIKSVRPGSRRKENETLTEANEANEEKVLCSLYCLVFNSSLFVKTLHTVTALIELGAGLALLVWPSATVALLSGVPLEAPAARTAARVGGGGLLGAGVAYW